jgi:hypothetical protein
MGLRAKRSRKKDATGSGMVPAWVWLILIAVLTGCNKSNLGTEIEASLPDLNRGLSMWMMKNGAPPDDIHELTNLPGLQGKSWPRTPPGKKLVLDAVQQRIVLIDQ